MSRIDIRNLVFGAVLIVAGMIAGAALTNCNVAQGELRSGPPPKAFKSGGQLSVPILQEIAATLRQMDGRLAQLEIAAQKLQTSRANSSRNGL